MTGLALWRWSLDIVWLLVLLLFWRHFWRSRQTLVTTQSWLKVKGQIILCQWTQVGHSAWPKIQYSYHVHEQDLVGEHLFLDTAHNNPHSKYARLVAYKAARAFQEQHPIDVYYNPNHPEQSALDIRMPRKLNLILLLISSLIVVHVGFMVWRVLG